MWKLFLLLLLSEFAFASSDFQKLKGFRAPVFSCTDAYGKNFDLKALQGKIVILSVGDKKASLEESFWNSWDHVFEFSGETVFVNVFFPGGISFSVPRGEVVAKIRKAISDRMKKLLSEVSQERRGFLKKLDIHWVIDWNRSISERFEAPRHEIIVFAIDRKGTIRDCYRHGENDLKKFIAEIKKIEAEK